MKGKRNDQRCMAVLFAENPGDFMAEVRYPCQRPCVEPGSRVVKACGRILIPRLNEDDNLVADVDPTSSPCAEARGLSTGLDLAAPLKKYL